MTRKIKTTTSSRTKRKKATVPRTKKTSAAQRKKSPARRAARPAKKGTRKTKHITQNKKKFRKMLLALREKIAGQISFLSADSLKAEKFAVPDENGSEEFDSEFILNLINSEQNALFQVDEGLRRLEAGTYGKCEHCGKTISVSRLESVPFAKLCIRCQANVERGGATVGPLSLSRTTTAG